MTSNLTLTPAEEPLWMMAYAAASTGMLAHYGNCGLAASLVEVCTPFADAAIRALRERRVAGGEVPFPVGARVRVWGADATVVSASHPGRYTVLCGDGVRYDVDAALVGAPVATGEAKQ